MKKKLCELVLSTCARHPPFSRGTCRSHPRLVSHAGVTARHVRAHLLRSVYPANRFYWTRTSSGPTRCYVDRNAFVGNFVKSAEKEDTALSPYCLNSSETKKKPKHVRRSRQSNHIERANSFGPSCRNDVYTREHEPYDSISSRKPAAHSR